MISIKDIPPYREGFVEGKYRVRALWLASLPLNSGVANKPRKPKRESGDNLFPRCALIRGMRETSNANW